MFFKLVAVLLIARAGTNQSDVHNMHHRVFRHITIVSLELHVVFYIQKTLTVNLAYQRIFVATYHFMYSWLHLSVYSRHIPINIRVWVWSQYLVKVQPLGCNEKIHSFRVVLVFIQKSKIKTLYIESQESSSFLIVVLIVWQNSTATELNHI